MPHANTQIIEQAKSTHALLKVIKEEKEQCFRDAYISDMDKVKEVLKRKCGEDPFRIQYNLGHLTIWARQKISMNDLDECFHPHEEEQAVGLYSGTVSGTVSG